MNLQALFLVATAIATRATAEFTVTSGTTQPAFSTMANVKISKLWTLTADSTFTTAKFIDSIELDVVGLVYVSYASNLPSGVFGYVNVSGDSQTVVDAVTVSNAGFFGKFDNDTEKLKVCSTSTTLRGYLLTEIFLASRSVVTDVKSQQTAEVVIEDGVLATRGSKAELEIEASGSSAVYVSAPLEDVDVEKLELNAKEKASLHVIVKSVSVTKEAEIESKESARITLLASPHVRSSFNSPKVKLEADDTATICIDADVPATSIKEHEGAGRISMCDAANSLFTCGVTKVPAREAACLSTPSTATGQAVLAPPRSL